ncbi:hypothetical protein D9M71_250180 [compost metagenome]
MHLAEILERHAQQPAESVPDWMLGYFKRRSISFANGQSDIDTHVCWLQSRNFTIDLRLPLERDQVAAKPLAQCSAAELQVLANYEGWAAPCSWQGETLRWHGGTSLQLNNRWPEPAQLKRIGDCMIEFAPSGAYVEDWRLQASEPGPLIGLRLLEERAVQGGALRHQGGGLIVCGEHAAMVLGRSQAFEGGGLPLRDWAARYQADPSLLATLFNFETSVAKGSLDAGFSITLSTRAERLHQPLLPLDGFQWLGDGRHLLQTLRVDGVLCQRTYAIDTLERQVGFAQATALTPEAASWFVQESPSLARYTKKLD